MADLFNQQRSHCANRLHADLVPRDVVRCRRVMIIDMHLCGLFQQRQKRLEMAFLPGIDYDYCSCCRKAVFSRKSFYREPFPVAFHKKSHIGLHLLGKQGITSRIYFYRRDQRRQGIKITMIMGHNNRQRGQPPSSILPKKSCTL